MTTRKLRMTAIVASIWTLVQSVIFLVLPSLGMMVFNGSLKMDRNPVEYLLYLIYFCDSRYSKTLSLSPLDDSLEGVDVTYLKTSSTSSRTATWMVVYLTITSWWVLTAFILMYGAIRNVYGKDLHWCTWPWAIVGALTLLADLIASIIYAMDIPRTLTFSKMFDLVSVTVPPEIDLESQELKGSWIPSAIMVVLFSRMVLFWLINLVLLVSVINEAYEHNRDPGRIWSSDQWAGPRPQSHREHDNRGFTSGENPPSLGGARPSPGPSSAYQESLYDRPYSEPSYSYPHAKRVPKPDSRVYDDGQIVSKLRIQYEQRMNRERKEGPEELRGQLPWSYFQDRHGPGGGRRAGPPGPEDSDYPPVPVPDYTLHFPKRGSNNAGSNPRNSVKPYFTNNQEYRSPR